VSELDGEVEDQSALTLHSPQESLHN